MKKYFIIAGILFLAACAAKKSATESTTKTPSDSEYLATAQKIDPSMTLETFSTTKSLFETECNRCHAVKKPASKPAEAWKHIIPDMVKKANRKGAAISPEQEKNLLTYVLAIRVTGM